MNRGSARLTAALLRGLNRFNEAPIHESGKYCAGSKRRRPATRFNEAPIHESGKSNERPVHARRNLLASMRPRFMNRGSSRPSVNRSPRGTNGLQ